MQRTVCGRFDAEGVEERTHAVGIAGGIGCDR
jgi:hypothetical protein